jgi:hypothetical protein
MPCHDRSASREGLPEAKHTPLVVCTHALPPAPGVVALRLSTLNCQRAAILIQSYMEDPSQPLLTPDQVRANR